MSTWLRSVRPKWPLISASRLRGRIAAPVVLLATCLLLAGCLNPTILHVDLAVAPPPPTSARDYQAAIESIVGFMKNELGIPFPPSVALYLYPNQSAFERGLQAEAGFAPNSALRTADYASAVTINGKVLVNEVDLFRVSWQRRVEILAHELVHVSQRHLAGGRRGWSVQWLREGFAEWGTTAALDRLGLESREVRFAKARGKVRWVFEGGDLPTLRQLLSPFGWAAVQDKPDGAASYELAMLATDFLLSRVGIPAVVEYFRNSTVLDLRGNFAQAFGLSLFDFEAEFSAHLKEMLR